MKDSVNKLKTFFYAAIALTAICALLFTISMFTAFDAYPGYFRSDAFIPVIQTPLAIVSVALFALIGFVIPKGELSCSAPENSLPTTFASLICGFITLSGSIMTFYYHYRNAAGLTATSFKVFVAICICGVIASIFYFTDALVAKDKALPVKVFTAIFAIAFLLLIIIFEHLDFLVGINTPRKTLLFLSFISTSMFLVQELKFKVGIGQPRAYFFFGASAMLLLTTLSVSHIAAHYGNVLKDSSFLIYYLVGLALAFYCFSKLLSFVKYNEYLASLVSDTDNAAPEVTDGEGEEV